MVGSNISIATSGTPVVQTFIGNATAATQIIPMAVPAPPYIRYIITNNEYSDPAVAIIADSTTVSNDAYEEDGLFITKNWNPSGPVAGPSNFGISGLDINLTTDPSNTQPMTFAFLSGEAIYVAPMSQTHYAYVHGLDIFVTPFTTGGTCLFDEIKGAEFEILMGDGATASVFNATQMKCLYLASRGWQANATGTIGSCYGLDIGPPRTQVGCLIQHNYALHINNQNDSPTLNPDSWGIFEDSTAQKNALGTLNLGGSAGPLLSSGVGSPNTVVTAPVGSVYFRTDGGTSTTFYVKETGAGNTGWVAK
jgi:hypothetical protein